MHLRTRRIQQNPPDLLPQLRAARLYRLDDVPPLGPQRRSQQTELRRLAAAVHPFESDKTALQSSGPDGI